MKKLLALSLALIMILAALVSCSGNTPDGAGDTEPPAGAEKITLIEKGKNTEYVVIFADELEYTLADSAADTLAYNINSVYGTEVESKNEALMRGSVLEAEILIGNTTRKESAEAAALLKGVENEYLIKLFDNGKLCFVASNKNSLREAVIYFATTVVLNGDQSKLALEKGYEYYVDLGTSIDAKWSLTALPEYTGGVLASGIYNIGPGLDVHSNAGRMHTVSETNRTDFDAYITELEKAGFEKTATNEINNNVYIQLANSKNQLAYVYYLDAFKEARIILDEATFCPEPEFEYTYTPKEGETAGIYQFAMMYDTEAGGAGQHCEGKYPNNGAFHIIRLSDNSVILIDGGWSAQATEAATEALVEFLYEITGTPEGEKIRIACWYLTHAHGDHFYFVRNLVRDHSEKFILERVMHNLTSEQLPADLRDMSRDIITKYPDVKYTKIHTGQKIQLADATIEVMLTHETLTDAESNRTIIVDYNDTSDIVKFTVNGKSFMNLGDHGGQWTRKPNEVASSAMIEAKLLGMYRAEDGSYPALKADIVQVAHHAINDWLENLYKAIDADYAFFPQADCQIDLYDGNCFKNIVYQLRATGMPDSNMYHANRLTHWLIIEQNGNITHHSQKLTGADEGYWYFLDADGKEIKSADGKLITVSTIEELDALDINVIVKEIALDATSGKWKLTDVNGKAITGTLDACEAAEAAGAVKAVYSLGYWDYIDVPPFYPPFFTSEA